MRGFVWFRSNRMGWSNGIPRLDERNSHCRLSLKEKPCGTIGPTGNEYRKGIVATHIEI
ncbi:MAG: hypothetical protein ACP5UZ_08765 [Thermoplasmata archaeon]